MPECAKCGKEFDSERGLKVHNSQVHDGDAEVLETKKEASAGNVTFRLNYRHALVIAFAVGILTGGFFTSMLLTMGGVTGMLGAVDVTDSGDAPSDNGGDVMGGEVDLSSMNHGVGSGTMTWNGVEISLEGQPYIGEEDAPVTIVSYEDFFCPFCGAYNSPDRAQELNANTAFKQIKDEYIESGDVKYLYKHLPVVGGTLPAVAAECVAEQDNEAFWNFKTSLYADQEYYRDIADNEEQFQDAMVDLAGETGVDTAEFESCYENQATMNQIEEDVDEARELGAQATPTIFINGQEVRGAQQFSTFQQVIESELDGS